MEDPSDGGIYDGLADYGKVPDDDEALLSDDDDDDPLWTKGLTGDSDDENPEEKAARKKARHERAIQESCIAAAADEKRKRKEKERQEREKHADKKKKKKKDKKRGEDDEQRISAKTHGGLEIVTSDGATFTVLESTRVPKTYVSEYGEHTNDSKLRITGTSRDGKDITYYSALRSEEDDLACIRNAFLTQDHIPLGELSVRIGLSRWLGSRERAEAITKHEPRHHLITTLPPFTAFNPACIDPTLTKAFGDKSKPFPRSLIDISALDKVIDKGSLFNQVARSCPVLGGFETVSGAQTYFDDNQVRRRTSAQDQDSTKKSLFTIRSSYSDITSLYWLRLSARDISLVHLLIKELVPISGVDSPACAKVLPPMTEYFSTANLNPPDGSLPWNASEGIGATNGDALRSVAEFEFRGKAEQQERTDYILYVMNKAINEVLNTPLPNKTHIFTQDRDPRRPARKIPFSVACLERFFDLCPRLRQIPLEWASDTKIDRRDVENLQQRYESYLKNYLDWRYFLLPDMVIGALAVAYETIHPQLSDGMVIRTLEEEYMHGPRWLKRMCTEPKVAYPAMHILFKHYHYTGYEKYAAALLLWNFIGRKKIFVNKLMVKFDNENPRDSDFARKPRRPVIKYRPEIVPFDAVFDMYGRSPEGSADMSLVCPKEFIDYIVSRINDVYEWNLFPQLFNGSVSSEKIRTPAVHYAAFDTESAIEHRRQLKEEQRARKRRAGDDEGPIFVAASDKATLAPFQRAKYKGRVTVSYHNAPKECQRDLDEAVKLFDQNFKLIGHKEYVKVGPGFFKVQWNAKRATKLIRAYMKVHKMLETKETDYKMMLSHVCNYRKEVPKMNCYMTPNTPRLLFRLNMAGDLGRWFQANLEQDSAKLNKLAK